MAKKWKVIRQTLAGVGYTSITSVADITITSMDADGTLYYTDENGDAVKVLYPSSTPIVVDPTTDTIHFSSATIYLAGLSGYTSTIQVLNDTDVDITAHCTYSDIDTGITTLVGTTLTAVASGTTSLKATHYSTSTGSTSIVVGQVNTVLSPMGGTLDGAGTGEFQITANTTYYLTTGITIQNQNAESVTVSTAKLYYYTTEYPVASDLLVSPNTHWTTTGTSYLVIYDYNAKTLTPSYTGVTYTVTVVE